MVARDNSDLVGVATLYGIDLLHGWGYFAAVVSPKYQRLPEAYIGLAAVLQSILKIYPLRKIYMEVPEFNLPLIESVTRGMGKVEATIPDANFYFGRYWDTIILALYTDNVRVRLSRFGLLLAGIDDIRS